MTLATLYKPVTRPEHPVPVFSGAHPATSHLRFEHIGKTYDTPQGPVQALHDIDLTIGRGEIFGIIGHSGAGKSSLLRTINRLEAVTAGRLLVNGQDIATLGTQQLVSFRRKTGMIFQQFNLLSARTVRENIELPLQVAGIGRSQRRRKAETLLALVGLQDKADMYPARLSGGQKQRVGIARALVHDPEILLCDEATSALDPETTQSILQLLKEINQSLSLTVVLITHEMSVIRQICNRVAVLDQGHIVEQGPVWQVFGHPRQAVTCALLAPLQHRLPPALEGQLMADGAGPGGSPILALDFSGKTWPGPDLAALGQSLQGRVRLLDAGLEEIQGHLVGRLLIRVDDSVLDPAVLLDRAGQWADHAEVLGHVAAA